MQREIITPTNGDRLRSGLSSEPFISLDQRFSSHPYLAKGGDLFGFYSSPPTPLPDSPSVSLTPSSVSFDQEDPTTTENRLHLARLILQYQEMSERYDLCLSHLHNAAEEVESLRHANAELRILNGELTRRFSLCNGRVPSSPGHPTMSMVNDFRRLCVGEPPAQASPTSVLGFEENRFERRGSEKRISLPKSISIRSSGFLKLNSGGTGAGLNRNGRLRVSSPVMVGSQRVYVGGGESKKDEKGGEGGSEEALEFDVYNQGMFKTELCNKWQETGDCPYGDSCQFAHGVGELRPIIRHPRYKTEVCRMLLTGDSCPYGHRCHFRHALLPQDHNSPSSFLRSPTTN